MTDFTNAYKLIFLKDKHNRFNHFILNLIIAFHKKDSRILSSYTIWYFQRFFHIRRVLWKS